MLAVLSMKVRNVHDVSPVCYESVSNWLPV